MVTELALLAGPIGILSTHFGILLVLPCIILLPVSVAASGLKAINPCAWAFAFLLVPWISPSSLPNVFSCNSWKDNPYGSNSFFILLDISKLGIILISLKYFFCLNDFLCFWYSAVKPVSVFLFTFSFKLPSGLKGLVVKPSPVLKSFSSVCFLCNSSMCSRWFSISLWLVKLCLGWIRVCSFNSSGALSSNLPLSCINWPLVKTLNGLSGYFSAKRLKCFMCISSSGKFNNFSTLEIDSLSFIELGCISTPAESINFCILACGFDSNFSDALTSYSWFSGW